jgi:nucleoid-associated protein YgaU
MGVGEHIRRRGTDRVFGAAIVLIVIWIGTYWLWDPEPRPRLSLASGDGAPPSVAPPTNPDAPRPDASPERAEPDAMPAEGDAAPPGTPAPPRAEQRGPRIVPPAFRDYTVREGDTFERIAQRLWGERALWTAVAQANPYVDPNRLRAGRVIRVPEDPGNVQGRAEGEAPPEPPEPAVEYVVRRGDTLSEIAARFYGSTSYTDFLYLANRARMESKNDLRVGQTLLIPPKPSPDGGAEP